MPVSHEDGFSSTVRIFLELNGETLVVAQVGESSLILREKCNITPGTEANVRIVVNGQQRTYPVILRNVEDEKIVHFEDKP